MSKKIYKRWRVDGLLVAMNEGTPTSPTIMRNKKFEVQYTSDKEGKSLSIADEGNGIMFVIPVDAIEKDIREGKT